jgi:hypothetical protein
MSSSAAGTPQELWRLAHEEKRPIKKAAAALGITVHQAYEFLAAERIRRDHAVLQRAVSGSE